MLPRTSWAVRSTHFARVKRNPGGAFWSSSLRRSIVTSQTKSSFRLEFNLRAPCPSCRGKSDKCRCRLPRHSGCLQSRSSRNAGRPCWGRTWRHPLASSHTRFPPAAPRLGTPPHSWATAPRCSRPARRRCARSSPLPRSSPRSPRTRAPPKPAVGTSEHLLLSTYRFYIIHI